MSMLIIGVNPPKSCYACSWYNKVECPVNDGRYYYRVQRHPSCPLVELPPHGRLGDLDKLMTEFMDSDLDHLQRDDWREVVQIVADAPTVIEAEGSETE